MVGIWSIALWMPARDRSAAPSRSLTLRARLPSWSSVICWRSATTASQSPAATWAGGGGVYGCGAGAGAGGGGAGGGGLYAGAAEAAGGVYAGGWGRGAADAVGTGAGAA